MELAGFERAELIARRAQISRRPIGLRLRLLDWLLRTLGVSDVSKQSDEELIAAQIPLQRNLITNWLFGSVSESATIKDCVLHFAEHAATVRVYAPLNPISRSALLYLHGGGCAPLPSADRGAAAEAARHPGIRHRTCRGSEI